MKEVAGDLIAMATAGQFDVIVHGCNCQKKMGKGIAKQIREFFPAAYEADQNFRYGPISCNKLGCVSYAVVDTSVDRVVIVNAYTQYNFWSQGDPVGQVYVDYDALRLCLRKIKRMWGGHNRRFGIPLIGAGLAGGDWSIISKIIDEEMAGEDLTLVRYQG